VGRVQAGLGQPHIMGEGLSMLGQREGGRGMVVARQGGGRGVQVASGTGSLSMGVVGGCVAGLFASVRRVGCRWWEGCQGSNEPYTPVIWQIECGQAVGGVWIAGWCSGGFSMVDRRWTGCWVRASGVQRAVLAGVVLWSSRSTIDRQIGCGGVTGACVVVGKIGGRGSGVRGLSGWVVVGCGIVVVGGVVTMGRGGGSNLSVMGLTCAFVGVAGVLLEGGGGGVMEFDGVSGGEGVGGGGSGVVVSGCGFHSGESLAEFFPLSWAFRLRSMGCHHGAGVKVGGFFIGCAGRKVGWFSVRKGLGVDNIGSFSSECRSACRSSLRVANARLSASLGWEGLGGSVRVVGVGAGAVVVAIAAAANWFGL